MIPQEHRVIAALEHLGPMVLPSTVSPRWYRMGERRHDAAIQQALAEAELPRLTEVGRRAFLLHSEADGYFDEEQVQGHADATGYWARLWCRGLGLPHRSAWNQDLVVDPTTRQRSTMTAHDRIQLLREEQAIARNLSARRASAPTGTDILSDPGVEP